MKSTLAGLGRAVLIGLFVGGLVVGAIFYLGMSLLYAAPVPFTPAPRDGTTTFDPLPFPRHTEWSQYDIDEPGYMVLHFLPDSTAEALDLPPGTQVYVPRVVPGETQSERDSRRAHEALYFQAPQ